MCRAVALLLLAACGRVGFEASASDVAPSGAPLFADGFEVTWAGPTQPQSTVYVDDVVVDLQPIRCR